MSALTLSRTGQRGFALIIALVVTTGLAVAALEMTRESRLGFRLAANFRDRTRARMAAMDGLNLAAGVLLKDDPSVDDISEAWAKLAGTTRLKPKATEGFQVGIWDEAARLPLNNIGGQTTSATTQAWEDMLSRLLVRLGRDPAAVERLKDWLDVNSEPLSGGAEAGDYPDGLTPRNGPLLDIQELYYIEGFDRSVMAGDDNTPGLEPLLSIHGQETMNINTMPRMLLEVLADGLGQSLIDQLVETRDDQAFIDLAALKELAGMDDALYASITPLLNVKSTRFRIRSRGRYGKAEHNLEVIIDRTAKGLSLRAEVEPTPWPTGKERQ